ncbi:hypothetical protein PTTG_00851 [Puccinia triticina 1-1 BBBD Race 1]|uniref:Uncharacterized protein n=2 Tax=Puccinia triticina TaxID=208348 RepID=A0A0C4EJD3_PUCT1|nr:uncharacterized protein PtA15_3A600 [Puccinia triticina]OAV93532.1 hypothetical protein PTTG_00851 [Puccinia triticina 1-1 BBBD Race 1]WAQ83231.1 hypothetical protein PtA15_3A600 [Puccinia triticina]
MSTNHDNTTAAIEQHPSGSTSPTILPTTPAEAPADASRVSVVPLPPPPSYAEASQGASLGSFSTRPSGSTHPANPNRHTIETSYRFPSGLFVLRNRSSLKVLDVSGAGTQVGTPVIAYSPKRPTLLHGDLFHKENNQLFFVDWHGCLCSASSGLRVDVGEDYRLVLSKPQPILSRPTRESHPPAQFRYDPMTRTIEVKFMHDPTYSNATMEEINSVDYLLEVQPVSFGSSRKSYSSTPFPLEKLSEWFPFATKSTTSTSNNQACSSSSPVVGRIPTDRSSLDIAEEEEDSDLDNSPDPARAVRVVSVAPGWREKFPSSGTPEARRWAKRQWDIASILVQPARPLSPDGSSLRSDHADPPISVLADLGEALGDLGHEIFRAFGGSTK